MSKRADNFSLATCLDLREFGFISANRQVARRKLSYANIGALNPQIIDPARQVRPSVSRQGPFALRARNFSLRVFPQSRVHDRSLIPVTWSNRRHVDAFIVPAYCLLKIDGRNVQSAARNLAHFVTFTQ